MAGKLLVYVAGPMSGDDVNANIQEAMRIASTLYRTGYNVLLPHLNQYLQRYWEQQELDDLLAWGYKEWMSADFAMLEKCDVLLRMEGESPGSDQEVAFAMGRGIPVVFSLVELKEYRFKLEKDSK